MASSVARCPSRRSLLFDATTECPGLNPSLRSNGEPRVDEAHIPQWRRLMNRIEKDGMSASFVYLLFYSVLILPYK
jgi:hypothetical protein